MKYVFSFFFILFLYVSQPVEAFEEYKTGSIGFDISYPQCPKYFPQDAQDFTIVGVNGGKAFTQNACLLDEYFWAKKAKKPISLYMNLNFPSGKTEQLGYFGPYGTCERNNSTCQAYNYGYTAAQDAYTYALSQFAVSKTWWIDVETANFWSDDFYLNNHVLQGAIDFLSSEGIQTGNGAWLWEKNLSPWRTLSILSQIG